MKGVISLISAFLLNELTADLYKSEMSKDALWLYNCPASGYYQECTNEEQQIYDLVLCSFMTGRSRITYTSTIPPTQMKQLLKYVVKDRRLTVNINEKLIDIEYSSELPGVGYSYIVQLTDKNLLDNVNIYNKLCRLQIEHVMQGIDESWDAFTTIDYLHDWVCDQTTYIKNSENCYNISGVLIDGEATCQGYAKTFNLLCELAGYDAVEISGYSNDSSHMWSYVEVDNDWYAFDVTWNDTGVGKSHHGFFGKPAKLMALTHEARATYKGWIPECSNKYNMWYEWRENQIVSQGVTREELEVFIAQHLVMNYQEGEFEIFLNSDDGRSLRDEVKAAMSGAINIARYNGYPMATRYKLVTMGGGFIKIFVEGLK